jgi:glutathione S-transferase/alpha,alpha-trehalase
VVWANAELDGLCFGKGMSGTTLDKPSKALDTLESIVGKSEWLVDGKFSIADVAVASYLNYVPIFFRLYHQK